MPAALIAASTLSICWAFWRIAVLPSAAWVTTPAEIVATSGTRRASALEDTFSRVPCTGAMVGAGTAALAVMQAPMASDRAISNGERTGRRIGFSFWSVEGAGDGMNAL